MTIKNLVSCTGGYLKVEKIKWGSKEYEVFTKPTKHIIIDALETKPTISARWNTKKDNPPKACTCDMIHLTPYKGCTVNCDFCSLPRYRGFGVLKSKHGVSVVFDNYDKYVDQEISKCNFLHTFDFGADADVFMAVNKHYHMAEKTMSVLNKWGIPFSVSTKGVFTDWAVEELAENTNSWAQISVITNDEKKRKQIISGEDGATIDEIIDNVYRLKTAGVHVTARLQPFIPYISENPKVLIPWLKSVGFDGVVFGLLRAPMGAGKNLLSKYSSLSGRDYGKLFSQKTPAYWQIPDALMHKIIRQTRRLCDENGLSFGLCDMYEDTSNGYVSLQEQYGSCTACETVNCYGYIKDGDRFKKVPKCIGNCLVCNNSPCGYPQFYESVKYTIKDYARLKV